MTPRDIHCLLHGHQWAEEPTHRGHPEIADGFDLECQHCHMLCSDPEVIKQYRREQTEQEIEL